MPFATHDGIRIRYEVVGSGPPLVLHPGFVGTVEDWEDAGYVDRLKDRFQLVMLDPRGQGQSDKPHRPERYGRRQRVADVLSVLDEIGIERAHFWGYSMGGWIGFELGVAAPERLMSLTIGGAFPFAGNPRPIEGDLWMSGFRAGMSALARQWEEADPEFWFSARERDQWLASDVEALIAARTQRLTEPDLSEDAVAAIRVPTLVYFGTHDTSISRPEEPDQLRRLMPDATIVALEGLNHAQAMGRADLVLPHVLPFLEAIGTQPVSEQPG